MVVWMSRAAFAQSLSEQAQYRSVLEEAVSEYDAHRYEEARALFRRAHGLNPNARTLRGIGMASYELREYSDALRALEGALADQRRPLTAPQRREVEVLLERTRAFVGRFSIQPVPKEASVRVDGLVVPLGQDSPLILGLGRHSVSAEAPHYVTETRQIEVIGGERQTLTFQLHPSEVAKEPIGSARAAAGDKRLLSPSGDRPDGSGRATSSSSAAWFVGASAMALGATGSAIWWRQRENQLTRCEVAGDTCVNGGMLTTQVNVALWITVALGAGSAALGSIGVGVWSTNRRFESNSSSDSAYLGENKRSAPDRGSAARNVGWFLTGVSAAGSLGFALLARSEGNDLRAARNSYPTTREILDRHATRATVFSIAADSLAVMTAVAGTLTLFSSGGSHTDVSGTRVSVGPRSMAVAVTF
jgi:hypothetical protein